MRIMQLEIAPVKGHEALCDGTINSQKVLHAWENLQMRIMQLEIAPVKGHEHFVTEL